MDQAAYYKGGDSNRAKNNNMNIESTSYKIRTVPYINNSQINRSYSFFLDVIGIVGVVLGLISITLSTISIIHHTRNYNVSTRADPYIVPIYDNVKELNQYYTEFIDPRLRNILDAVTFQIPKTLSTILSATTGGGPETGIHDIYQTLNQIGRLVQESINTVAQLTSIMIEQFEETKLIVRDTNDIMTNNNLTFVGAQHPFRTYPRIHTITTGFLPPLQCPRSVPTVAPKRIAAFLSNVGGLLDNSCVKEPVISIGNGVVATTFLFFKSTCTDFQTSIRFFEIGIIKRNTELDPYPTILHTWDKVAPPVLQPCSLAVAYDQGYALCAESTTGVENDIITGNNIRMVLFIFSLIGGLEIRYIEPNNFPNPRDFINLIPYQGQAVVIGSKLYSFGYYTTLDAVRYPIKCPIRSCSGLTQDTCEQYSKSHININTHKELIILGVDLANNPVPNHEMFLIQRDTYHILAHGNLYYRNSNTTFLFQLYNNGWLHKPLVGKLVLSNPVTIEFYNKEYDIQSSTSACIPGFGCPSSCEITAQSSYFPLDYNFNDAIGILPRNQGSFPSISYGSGSTRIDFRVLISQQLALLESSLFCYLPTISNNGSPYCVGLLTIAVAGQTYPELYSISWEQHYRCRK
ncbi:cell attachment protein [denalis virus]|uniref:Cell attachment protein n=1 Tax=denalis virus TaxID=2940991 RepID=A0AAE9KYY7_9MONO|nr:cell attachment protein [denalis virus]